MTSYPVIPYGVSDFGGLRRHNMMYVDKTRFIRELERRRHAFFIRPRRFGKSLWVSVLECYYDRTRADGFDEVFGGTDIAANPTPSRSRYVVLRFDFSVVRAQPSDLEEEFAEHCEINLEIALERNGDLFSESARRRILGRRSLNGKIQQAFAFAASNDIPVCVLIDEYDNFANTILAHEGEAAYQELTHGGGFFRSFFATLKGGTARGGVERLFMTGVSPVTLDDVTSGFNIADNISLEPDFAEMVGFTEVEVRQLLEDYRDWGAFAQDVDAALDTMREWYDGYRFAKGLATSVYNTDMVLYYLNKSIPNRRGPYDLIDDNVRIDYGKLRHLMLVSRRGPKRLNGNFDLLRHLVGEGREETTIRTSFPLERLVEPENFLSLLYYFGLLGIEGNEADISLLRIPNQTVRRLLYGYIRDAYRDVELFSVRLDRLTVLISRMAMRGEWRPVVDFLSEAIAEQTGIRDYIAGEKVLQGFFAAYFGISNVFLMRSEGELGKGYPDLVVEPATSVHPDMGFGYVIEMKYVARGESPPDAEVATRLAAGRSQLRRYLSDASLRARYPSVRFVGLALVFHGWELVACEEVLPTGPSPVQ